jgi:xanthine dehydrogenase YagS FAD-binding subunit
MIPFTLTRPKSVADALQEMQSANGTANTGTIRFIAGGTTLVDLMKLEVERPHKLVDINHLPLDRIERTPEGGLRIGALVRNAAAAADPDIRRDYPVLSEALLSGASGQLRNMASTGGNLLQRTRCVYFRDPATPCNKREPGSGCSAIDGYNRSLAILGTSEHCVATNPSDMNVALTALEATIEIAGSSGTRNVPIAEFFMLPGDRPEREHVLRAGELITGVTLPSPLPGARSHYLKLRDRASYEFALASAAVVITAGETVERVRIALGGVGTVPWRAAEAEELLLGKSPTPENYRACAELALRDARPQSQNGFKIELAKRCLVHALVTATAGGKR